MANDLVTRLLLNSTLFDNNIIKSTKQVQNFQGQAAKMRSGLGSLAKAFTPLAAGIGIAMSAQEAFNKVINSSQTLSDSYNKTMNQGKQVVNEFFYALGSGDFSNFTTGISTIIQLAGDAYESLDKLGNAKISFGYFNMKNQAAFAENEAIAKDKNSTPEQIAQANLNINNILADQSEMVTEYAKKSENAVIDLIEATAGVKLENAGMVNVEKILKFDISAKGEEDKARLGEKYNEYLKKQAKTKEDSKEWKNIGTDTDPVWRRLVNQQKYKKAMESVIPDYQDAIMYNAMLNKKGDEQLKTLTNIATESFSVSKGYEDMVKKANRINDKSNTGGKVKIEIVPEEGSLAKLSDEISKKKTEISLAINEQSRIALYKELDALENKKRTIEFRMKYQYDDSKAGSLKMAGLPTQGLDTKGIKLDKIENPIKSNDIGLNNEYAESLANIGAAMGNIAGATNEGAGAWMQWGATMASAIATNIPLIIALTGAKEAEATASAKAALFGVASSAAAIPIVGWAMAGAAVASLVAMFATMPKFASGGIFTGGSSIGDMNLARVNSGEMILNHTQQGRLFNILDGRGTLDGNGSGGQVEFKIKGRNLEGALKKNNKINNRIR